MNDFTASNGVAVGTLRDGCLRIDINPEGTRIVIGDAITVLMPEVKDALREFFQAEADERLGRWRWLENPDYVVYSMLPLRARVVNERDGAASQFTEADTRLKSPSHERSAARAYFDAHPEPKPWHDAAEGEAWILRIGDDPADEKAWMAEGDGPRFWRGGHSIDRLSASITAGRRIWPEVGS